MAEYIERKRAIVDACNSLELYPAEYARLEDALNKIPAADVAQVRHGRWKQTTEPLGWDEIDCAECSECKESWIIAEDFGIDEISEFWHYCPNCGAKMDGERKTE